MEHLQPYIPVLMLLIVAFGFGIVTIMLGGLIGPKRYVVSKYFAYESGNIPIGEANVRIPVKFYLVALLFLLFDMETVLILAWAIAFRDPTIPGFQPYAFCVMIVFMLILIVGFLYEWRKGALEWN